jgi:hypothetical protein
MPAIICTFLKNDIELGNCFSQPCLWSKQINILVDSVMPAIEVANPIPCEQHGQCLRDVKTHSSADLHRRDIVDKCVNVDSQSLLSFGFPG